MKFHKLTKIVLGILVLLLLAGAVFAVVFYEKNLRGAGPAFLKPAGDITAMLPGSSSVNPASSTPGALLPVNNTNIPLKLPDGFSISIFAKNLPGARVMAFDNTNHFLYVSQISQGKISRISINADGSIGQQTVLLQGLKNPHGLAFDPTNPTDLYFAEENKISVLRYRETQPDKIIDLPGGGEHTSRTIGFGPGGRLYVSIGSTCNACNESDERRAAISSINKDGSDFKKVANGLRNSVFFIWDSGGRMWATDMGRDYLGDNLPPDDVNIIENGKNYGWPICYGQNIHDTNFDKNTYIRDPCADKIPSRVEIPAHSAPLGLAFVPQSANWPEQYRGKLLVALHGSSMNENPVGYKIVSLDASDLSTYKSAEDLVSGWLPSGVKGRAAPRNALGRPVDLVFDNGILYVSDDKAGVIYRVEYVGSQK